MTRIKISQFVGGELSGSSISDPNANHGCDPGLVEKLSRVVPAGGTVDLGVVELHDLADWASCMVPALAQGGNPSGARSLARLAERCLVEARDEERRQEAHGADH